MVCDALSLASLMRYNVPESRPSCGHRQFLCHRRRMGMLPCWFFSPSVCGRVLKPCPLWGYCEWRCRDHRHTAQCGETCLHFSWVNTQEWHCWHSWEMHLWLWNKLLSHFPKWLRHLGLIPATPGSSNHRASLPTNGVHRSLCVLLLIDRDIPLGNVSLMSNYDKYLFCTCCVFIIFLGKVSVVQIYLPILETGWLMFLLFLSIFFLFVTYMYCKYFPQVVLALSFFFFKVFSWKAIF